MKQNIKLNCLLLTIIIFTNILLHPLIANASVIFCNGSYLNKKLTIEEVRALSGQAEKPNLCGADLSYLDLTDLNLANINLSHVKLTASNLNNANLEHSNLYNANLAFANLSNAILIKTNLELATLNFTNFSKANLYGARLQTASMKNANFNNTILTLADLDEVQAQYATFTNADLSLGSLRKANLNFTNLIHSNLYASDLTNTTFYKSNLQHAILSKANLTNVDFTMANLSFASIQHAKINNTIFAKSNLYKLDYRPQYNTMPDLISLATAKNFSTVQFYDQEFKSLPMLILNTAYKNLGLTSMQRLTSSMLKHAQLNQQLAKGSLNKFKSFINYLLFGYPCNYGLDLHKPIYLMAYLALIFTILYWSILAYPAGNADLLKTTKNNKISIKKTTRYYLLWLIYFSFLNMLNIGFANHKLAKFISNLQQKDYSLVATGTMRTIAGLQTLISNYLFILWILINIPINC